jgi:hypothetical protein
MVSPFIPSRKFFEYLQVIKMEVYSADGGTNLGSVDTREVAGIVAADISRVDVVLEGGASRTVPIVDQAFYFSANRPAPFPVRVVAFDDGGIAVSSHDLASPSAPGDA